MNAWELPDSAQIGGITYPINADYRDILDIISRLTAMDVDEPTKVYTALALFYEGFDQMPESDYVDAAKWLYDFIACGEQPDDRPHPKTIDWEQDRTVIVSEINKIAGYEIRALPFLHWWTFIGWFNGIGDGQLAAIVSIREKIRKGKKLTVWEQQFYKENRSKVDFKTTYSAAEDEALKQWGAK